MRAAFYGRVSTEEQSEKGSIANQVDFARGYFHLHGPAIGLDDYEVYLDEGVSGTVPLGERPAGAKLMADGAAGGFQAVYVYRLDRLARSTLNVLSAYEFFDKYNIALKSMTEMFDTGTSAGKFFMTMLASIAALERDTILERTMLGKERAVREGRWPSGLQPYGYRVGEAGRLVVYPPEAEIVRLIFKLYLAGMRTLPLADYLNALNIPTPARSKKIKRPSSGKWYPGHISIILRGVFYTGEYQAMRDSKYNRAGSALHIPPIISREDYNAARAMTGRNSDLARTGKKRNFLLRRIILCGHCGTAMTGNNSSGRVYYRCPRRTVTGRDAFPCPTRQVRAEPLERAVWKEIINFLKNPGPGLVFSGEITACNRPGPDQAEEAAVIEAAISAKKNARRRILSLVARGIVDENEAEAELAAAGREMEALQTRREQLDGREADARESSYNTAVRDIDTLEKYRDRFDALPPVAEIIKLLVKRIEVFSEEKKGKYQHRIVVQYRFTPFGHSQGKPGLTKPGSLI